MKPYGIPRNRLWIYPDMGDILELGLKSCHARRRGRSGDIKGGTRDSKQKRQTRRRFKRLARLANRQAVLSGLDDR